MNIITKKRTVRKDNNFIWWKHGVIYHIYPRSFYDSNNDGIGDIAGIIDKLPYLKQLGIDAIWLSPIYESPQIDFGYDVSNYRSIDPIFGTMNDFKQLLRIAHTLNIKVIIDMILNHTSNQHPWFIESQSSKNNPKRNWYIWKNTKGSLPNNWRNAMGKTAWSLDPKTEEYYYHSFLKEQPDLNWRNAEVKEAMFKEVRFWLDLGVDGLRLDVINMIAKDKNFRNNPLLIKQLTNKPKLYTRNRRRSIKIIKELRSIVNEYEDRMCIGEIFTLPPGDSKLAASYLGNGKNGLHLAFDFSIIFTPWNAKKWAHTLSKSMAYIPKNGWATHVFSNHDLNRSFSKAIRKKYRLPIAKLKALLLITLKGTPFIYYGEEIGMENTPIKRKQIQDPMGKIAFPFYKGRDKARTPMQWNNAKNAGFSLHSPWLQVNSNFKTVNVHDQQNNPDSLWNLYKNLIKLRKDNKCLQLGNWNLIPSTNKNLLAYKRNLNRQELVVIINFNPKKQDLNILSKFEIIFSTHNLTELLTGSLLGFEGVIIKPKNGIFLL